MHIFWVESMTHGFTSIPETQDCVKRTPSCAAFVPEGFRLQICSRTSWAIHLGNFVDPDAMLSIETEKVFPAKKYHSCCRQAKWLRWHSWRLELTGWGVGPRVWLNLVANHGTCFKRISIIYRWFPHERWRVFHCHVWVPEIVPSWETTKSIRVVIFGDVGWEMWGFSSQVNGFLVIVLISSWLSVALTCLWHQSVGCKTVRWYRCIGVLLRDFVSLEGQFAVMSYSTFEVPVLEDGGPWSKICALNIETPNGPNENGEKISRGTEAQTIPPCSPFFSDLIKLSMWDIRPPLYLLWETSARPFVLGQWRKQQQPSHKRSS